MLYLWDLWSISIHIGFLVIILLSLQSFLIAADKTWSFIVFPVIEYEAASLTPLTIPRYLNAISVPDGAKVLQPDRIIIDEKIIIFF
jgi:hypothetical protein